MALRQRQQQQVTPAIERLWAEEVRYLHSLWFSGGPNPNPNPNPNPRPPPFNSTVFNSESYMKRKKKKRKRRNLRRQSAARTLHPHPRDLKHSVRKPRVAKRYRRSSAQIFLPYDIMADILSRLAVKSLARFRCVCKQWCSLTYDPYFMDEQHKRAFNRPIIISSYITKKIMLYDFGAEGKIKESSFEINLGEALSYKLSNSVNGLTCAYDIVTTGSSYHLLNPITRELLKLPTSCREDLESESLGLGFDVSTGEYKVVRLFSRDSMKSCSCEILTLGTREWRYIGETPCMVVLFMKPVFVHGTLHWKAFSPKDGGYFMSILTFDIKDETFGVISIPQTSSKYHCPKVGIMELQGQLCVVSRMDSKPHFKIWMLKDYRSRKWTKEYSINTYSYSDLLAGDAIIGIVDEKIMFEVSECSLFLGNIYCYDFQSKTFYRVYREAGCNLVIHTESLVSPNKLLTRQGVGEGNEAYMEGFTTSMQTKSIMETESCQFIPM